MQDSDIAVWKDIPGYEGCYQVNELGQVKSLSRYKNNRHGGQTWFAGRMLKLKVSETGYQIAHLRTGKNAYRSVHRLVAEAFIPNPENKQTVNHIDGNKLNNNVANLEWSTHQEQMQHAFANDLCERRGTAKFSQSFIDKVILFHSQTNCSMRLLALQFNISQRSAGRMVNGTCSRSNRISDEVIALVVNLRDKGWTLSSISKIVGYSVSHIHRAHKGVLKREYERN